MIQENGCDVFSARTVKRMLAIDALSRSMFDCPYSFNLNEVMMLVVVVVVVVVMMKINRNHWYGSVSS